MGEEKEISGMASALQEEADGDEKSRGEWPAGRAQLLAKKGASGRMQRPPELVYRSLSPSRRLRKAPESCFILEKSRKKLVKNWQNSAKF